MSGGLGGLLAAAAGPLAKRVCIALGVGVVTFAGLDTAIGSLLADARNSWAGLSGDAAAFVSIAGLNSGLAILAGAITARLTLYAVKKFGVL